MLPRVGIRTDPNAAAEKALSIADGNNNGLYLNVGTSGSGTTAAFGLNWYNYGSGTDVDNALVLSNIEGYNRVGIGTASPGCPLQVDGYSQESIYSFFMGR